MKLFTEKAISIIRANEAHEISAVSFALGLLGARVHIGTDFVDDGAWYVGDACRQYIAVRELAKNTHYKALPHLNAAAIIMEEEIARHEEYADFTDCILSEVDYAWNIRVWAEKRRVDSVMLRLIEAILKPEQEEYENDEIFVSNDITLARLRISSADYSRQSIAHVLVSAWQGLETRNGWGK